MISNMRFGVSVVRDFLRENGHVLTVRGYNYATTAAAVPDLGGIRIKRTKLGEIKTEEDLTGFVSLSGFKNAADWMKQIRRFCKGKMYLYRVTLDKEEQDPAEDARQRARGCNESLTVDEVPGFTVDRTRYKYMDGSTATEEYNIYDDMSHSLDIRSDPGLRDPADIDLQPFRDAAHHDRLATDARRAERRRERMRKR